MPLSLTPDPGNLIPSRVSDGPPHMWHTPTHTDTYVHINTNKYEKDPKFFLISFSTITILGNTLSS